MARTRSAVLAGARECLIRNGHRRTTMGDVALAAGVAKATLYNHFRTKEDVMSALVALEVSVVTQECAAIAEREGAAAALGHAAVTLGEHPVLRRLALHEPGVVAALLLSDPGPPPVGEEADRSPWDDARAALQELLAAPEAVETALAWLLGCALRHRPRDQLRAGAQMLVRGLPDDADAPPEPATPESRSWPHAAAHTSAPVPS